MDNNCVDNQCIVVGKYKVDVKILGVTFDNRMTLQKHKLTFVSQLHAHQENKHNEKIPLTLFEALL